MSTSKIKKLGTRPVKNFAIVKISNNGKAKSTFSPCTNFRQKNKAPFGVLCA